MGLHIYILFIRVLSQDLDGITEWMKLSCVAIEDANNYSPAYSPSGKYIAFISNRIGYWNHLFIMTENGHDVTQITDGYFDVNSIVWGNDGYLYFSANAGGSLNIWRLKPNMQ